ncbi:MAG: hypothetical protein NTV39_03930 [Candidatus Saccharibacteria bacterium]|nr:hypothetical protein [Candidatus Saccharibacteria bacterium]
MKPVKINGFTIVETMLFLAISALLIMGILVGTGSSINVQRYRDSVTSFQSYLQKQYSNVANVSNDSDLNTCNGVANNHTGQSECVILGKYITVDNNSNKTVNVKNIIGIIPPANQSVPDNDLDAIKAYGPTVSDVGAESFVIDWESSAVKTDGSPTALSMIILRSPSSGIIRTFISSNNSTIEPISTILDASSLSQPAKICLDSNGLFTGKRMAVQIDGNSTGASGVEILGDNSGC